MAACATQIFKRTGFKTSMTLSILFFVAGFVSLIFIVGNPSRLFNVLSNPTAGFSMMSIGLAMMIVFSVLAISTVNKEGAIFYVVALIGTVAIVCLFYGLMLLFVKPSRTALNSWHIPFFMFACVIAMGGITIGRVARIAGLVMKIVAVGGFLKHLTQLEIPDKYLSMELITGSAAKLMFGWVIVVGIVLPLALEFIGKKRLGFIIVEALAILAGNTAFFVLINITANRVGNMI
ncbi:MAG: hypothetical protein LBD73_01105 [Deferribacteraceae bacterium]|jgi:hypothetical protein|nr:hypothetical protein [Deferribacteraceae bacterium]